MKVKCVANRAGKVFDRMELPFGTFEESEYGVNIGEVYTVMGMHLWRGELSYFVFNGSFAELCAARLFEVVESKISSNWYFRHYDKNESEHTDSLWGYYEFCFDESHYEKLIDCDKDAMLLMQERLKEMGK